MHILLASVSLPGEQKNLLRSPHFTLLCDAPLTATTKKPQINFRTKKTVSFFLYCFAQTKTLANTTFAYVEYTLNV